MHYIVMNETDIEEIVGYYIDYYNHHDGGCWQYEMHTEEFTKWLQLKTRFA